MTEAADILAKYIVNLKYDDLPPEVVGITRKGILDTLGVTVAASGAMPDARGMVELMRDIGGKPEATVLGFGDRIPAWHAAYVNGLMSHLMDYDDLLATGGHINAPVLPAAFAMAERRGNVSGKEFIAAAAVGVDLLTRLLLATGRGGEGHEWNPMPALGVFGASAACSRLLGLDEDKTIHALGIAFTQSAGTLQAIYDVGSNIRGMLNGLPGEVGVRAPLMAQIGITGVRNIFEGKAGLMKVYFGGKYNRSVLLDDLGRKFPVLDDGFKPWPSCGFSHAFIDAALQVVTEHDIRADQVNRITVSVGDMTRNLCEPLEERRKPTTTMNAKFSIPFTVALAVARRKVVIGDFLPENLADPEVLKISRLVNPKVDPEYNWGAAMPPARVEIETRSGQTFSKSVHTPYGNPKKPMSWDDLVTKFRDCCAYSAKPLPRENVDRAVEMITHLEDVKDVGAVVRLLG